MLIEPLDLRTVTAGLNGGVYVNLDLSLIESYTLDPATAKRAVNLILDHGLDVWVYTEDEWIIRDQNAPHAAREAKVVTSFADAHLAHAWTSPASRTFRAGRCQREGRSEGPRRKGERTRWQPYFIDVTDSQANKGAVVAAVSKRMNIPPQQIATTGDGANDVLRFHNRGFSIAMAMPATG